MKKKHLQWAVVIAILGLYLAIPTLAQDEGTSPNSFANKPTLWIAIIIGLVTSATTGVYAFQLKGGVVGTALTFIGAGMLLVVLGFLAVVVPGWASEGTVGIVHDVAFIIGYILMLVGALRLRQMIR